MIEQIRMLMRRMKWTVEDVAGIVGVSRPRMSARLNGSAKFDIREVEKILEQAGKKMKIE